MIDTISRDTIRKQAAEIELLKAELDVAAEEEQALRSQNDILSAAIRNQTGDHLCHWPEDSIPIPPREEFLESCSRYHARMISGGHPILTGSMTISELEAECERLRVENARLLGDPDA